MTLEVVCKHSLQVLLLLAAIDFIALDTHKHTYEINEPQLQIGQSALQDYKVISFN